MLFLPECFATYQQQYYSLIVLIWLFLAAPHYMMFQNSLLYAVNKPNEEIFCDKTQSTSTNAHLSTMATFLANSQ